MPDVLEKVSQYKIRILEVLYQGFSILETKEEMVCRLNHIDSSFEEDVKYDREIIQCCEIYRNCLWSQLISNFLFKTIVFDRKRYLYGSVVDKTSFDHFVFVRSTNWDLSYYQNKKFLPFEKNVRIQDTRDAVKTVIK